GLWSGQLMTFRSCLIGLNRPEKTRRLFEAVRAAAPQRLYLAADGPRAGVPSDLDRCERARQVLNAGARAARGEEGVLTGHGALTGHEVAAAGSGALGRAAGRATRLAVRLPLLIGPRDRRGQWISVAAEYAGRLSGVIRYRIVARRGHPARDPSAHPGSQPSPVEGRPG